MSKELTPKLVEQFWAMMSQHYDTTILRKNDDLTKILSTMGNFSIEALKTVGTEIYLVGLLLDKMGILDVRKFMTRYTTTLGDRIYVPFDIGDEETHSLEGQLRICVHEHVHVLQYRKEPLSFVIRYLADRAQRAIFEAEAFRSNMEMDYFLNGTTSLGYAKILSDYGCEEADIKVAEKYLRQSQKTIEAGGITSAPSKVAIRWLKKHM